MTNTSLLFSKCHVIVMNMPSLTGMMQPPRTSMLERFTIVSVLAVVSLFICVNHIRWGAGQL